VQGKQMNTPVVFIIFKRPETTAKVFSEIARAKPRKLFVIADGPRVSRAGEKELCEATRKLIQVDWDCEVKINYSNENLGLRKRIVSGLNWVFENETSAIILEDDCLPDPTFFRFCDEMLNKYKDETKIMHIAGDNHYEPKAIKDSYYFSRYPHCWGWATWKRAWSLYDDDLKTWDSDSSNSKFSNYISDKLARRYWSKVFKNVKLGVVDSWAYRWTFTCFYHHSLCIIPRVNLVSNIGFGPGATHTKSSDTALENLPVHSISFPLLHPTIITRNEEADRFVDINAYQMKNFVGDALNKIQSYLKIIFSKINK
jgi:hypothetical protein